MAEHSMISILLSLLILLLMSLGAFPLGMAFASLLGSLFLFGVAGFAGGSQAFSVHSPVKPSIQVKDKRGNPMHTPLTETEIQTALGQFPGWHYADQQFYKRFEFQNFREAISFIVRLSFEAEALNHHPALSNVYQTVEIRLTTHDAGNQVTDKDLALMRAIEGFNWLP